MQVAFFGLILHKSVGREDEFSKSKGGAAHLNRPDSKR